MKIGIICAGDRELAPFLAHIENDYTTKKTTLTFHEGNINGMPVVILYGGVCKANFWLTGSGILTMCRSHPGKKSCFI